MTEASSGRDTLHSLSFLYVVFGHGSDGELSSKEVKRIVEKVHEWSPKAKLAEAASIVHDAIRTYIDCVRGGEEQVSDAMIEVIGTLKETLGEKNRRAVLGDLVAIAVSDGPLLENEETLVRAIADAWQVEIDDLLATVHGLQKK